MIGASTKDPLHGNSLLFIEITLSFRDSNGRMHTSGTEQDPWMGPLLIYGVAVNVADPHKVVTFPR